MLSAKEIEINDLWDNKEYWIEGTDYLEYYDHLADSGYLFDKKEQIDYMWKWYNLELDLTYKINCN